MTTSIRLHATPVMSAGQLNCMRVIRNAGSASYSGDDVQISEAEQANWWRENQGNVYAWLYSENGTVVGYGMIFKREHWSPSVGVVTEYQGRGFGKWIVSDLVLKAWKMDFELYAQAKHSNPAGVKTHDLQLWDRLGQDDTFVYFRSKVLG